MKPKSDKIEELKKYFQTHNKTQAYKAHSYRALSLNWSCDGMRLASGSNDNSVSIYTLDRDRLNNEYMFREHTRAVNFLCWHPSNANLLSTVSADKSVRIWDVRSQNCVANIATLHENRKISWAPNGNTTAVLHENGRWITFIDTRTNKIVVEKQFSFIISDISWNKMNDLFLTTKYEHCIPILKYPDPVVQLVLDGPHAFCVNIEFDPKGNHFATASIDASVSIWNASNLTKLHTLKRLNKPVFSLSFSHDGKLLATGSAASGSIFNLQSESDAVVDIAYTETGEKIADIEVGPTTLCLAFHPKEYLLAYACDDANPYDINLDSGKFKVWGFF